MSRNKKNCFLRQKILFTTEFLQPRCQGSGKYPAISQLTFVYPTTSTKDMIRTLLVFKIERFEILFLLVAVMGKHPFLGRFSWISWCSISQTKRVLSKPLVVGSIWVVYRMQTQGAVRYPYVHGWTWYPKSVSFDFLKFVKTAKVKFEFRVNKLSFTDHLYGVGKPLICTTYMCKDICWILIHFSIYAIKVVQEAYRST